MAKNKETLVQENAALVAAAAAAANQVVQLNALHAGSLEELAAAKERLSARDNEIVELKSAFLSARDSLAAETKKLATSEQNQSMWYKDRCRLEEEKEQLHAFLDEMPGAPPRSREVESRHGDQTITLSLLTRIATCIALAKQN